MFVMRRRERAVEAPGGAIKVSRALKIGTATDTASSRFMVCLAGRPRLLMAGFVQTLPARAISTM